MPGSPSAPPPGAAAGVFGGPRSHFRAHPRRPVKLPVILGSQRLGQERRALVVDVSLAGAGLQTDEPLVPGERLSLSFATPTMWDPLVVFAVVAWASAPLPAPGLDPLGRARTLARGGVAFEYRAPDVVLAMFEMLSALDYE